MLLGQERVFIFKSILREGEKEEEKKRDNETLETPSKVLALEFTATTEKYRTVWYEDY